MSNMTRRIYAATVLAALLACASCGGKTSGNTANSSGSAANKTAPAGDSKTSTSSTSTQTSTSSAGSPSTVVKAVYDNAMKRNCSAIPPMLTEDFRKEAGTSPDALDALCDTFTDSGKLASFEVKGEQLNGDSAKVTTALTYKDGKKEDKEDSLTKVDGKWLMEP